jgi:hypothetical protein
MVQDALLQAPSWVTCSLSWWLEAHSGWRLISWATSRRQQPLKNFGRGLQTMFYLPDTRVRRCDKLPLGLVPRTNAQKMDLPCLECSRFTRRRWHWKRSSKGWQGEPSQLSSLGSCSSTASCQKTGQTLRCWWTGHPKAHLDFTASGHQSISGMEAGETRRHDDHSREWQFKPNYFLHP